MTTKRLAIAAVLALCFASAGFAQSVLDSAPRMELEQFKKLYAENALTVVDVRTQSEYQAGHIPGALLAPLSFLSSYLPELSERPRPIVVYCS